MISKTKRKHNRILRGICLLTGLVLVLALLSSCGKEPVPLEPTFPAGESPEADTVTGPESAPDALLGEEADALFASATVLDTENAVWEECDDGVCLRAYIGPSDVTALIIPATLGGKRVSAVSEGALFGCYVLRALATPIPEGTCLGSFFAEAGRGATFADNPLYVPASLQYLDVSGDLPDYALRGCRDLLCVRLKNAARLGHYAMWGCASLQAVDLPEGLVFAGEEALARTALSDVALPASLAECGLGVLRGCDGLRTLTLPLLENVPLGFLFGARDVTWSGDFMPPDLWEVTYIMGDVRVLSLPAYALSGCTARAVNLPEGLTDLGIRSLADCPYLRCMSLPASLQNVGEDAFFNDLRLTVVLLPEGLATIGDRAFYGCVSLTDAPLPASLKRIGSLAFAGCRSLTDTSVPDGVDVCDFAFAGCR